MQRVGPGGETFRIVQQDVSCRATGRVMSDNMTCHVVHQDVRNPEQNMQGRLYGNIKKAAPVRELPSSID